MGTSNNIRETWNDLKTSYLPVFLRVLLKVLVTNYGSPSFEELYLVDKSSLSVVFIVV